VLGRYFLGPRGGRRSAAAEAAVEAHLRKVQPARMPEQVPRPVLRLGDGTARCYEDADNITAIDEGRRAIVSAAGKLPSRRLKASGRVVGGRTARSSN
jgi:hypothetical protein